ncbi:DNA fragmentation factor subunit beta [Microcaecilia unicolor]|uniref:DNA fragmentation factor subunit beta n=1 Tax=Microcaecilia unicolor TaxID=1415580 RepID=A0A6P7ZXB7_9AMPH|nr:DNA fragmentation factor subunit beta [Microcaecilia unicolor]
MVRWSLLFSQPKLCKLRTLQGGGQKYGIAARSVRELMEKGCKKFQLPPVGCQVCLYEDGTELSEGYFKKIPDNTEVVLLTEGQTWQGYVSEMDCFLNSFYKNQETVVEAAQRLLSDEQAPQRQKILADLIQTLRENIAAETREEDKEWFEGIEPRFKNKSSYMRYSCESRMRSYMKEVENYTSAVDQRAQDEYKRIAELLWNELKSKKYNGSYFDRREMDESSRLCTPEGWFFCKGSFDLDMCLSKHSINPYGNRESRILFSTWNLDHKIEKKRAIVPALAEAVKEMNGREVNWEYFYQLLFTVDNLKLVHIACHKKISHNLICNTSRIYKKRKSSRKKAVFSLP